MTPKPDALRSLRFGMKGPDVLAAQRAVRKALADHRVQAVNRQSKFYGDGTVKDVIRIQKFRGLKTDGNVGPKTWAILLPHVDAYGKWLLGRAPKPVAPEDAARLRVVHECIVMLCLAPRTYIQARPYPHTLGDFKRLGSDCSGSAELAHELAGVPDPNASHYNGQAWTQSQDKQGVQVQESQAEGGDLTFYERPSGHVVVELGDGTVFSHGSPGGPRRLPRHYRGDYSQTRRYPLT